MKMGLCLKSIKRKPENYFEKNKKFDKMKLGKENNYGN